MNLVHVVLAAHAVAARLWRAGPGHDASPARLRRAGPGRGLAAVARHAGPGHNGPRPGPVGGPVLTKKHEPKGLLAVQANYIQHTARLMHVPLMLVLKLPLFL